MEYECDSVGCDHKFTLNVEGRSCDVCGWSCCGDCVDMSGGDYIVPVSGIIRDRMKEIRRLDGTLMGSGYRVVEDIKSTEGVEWICFDCFYGLAEDGRIIA